MALELAAKKIMRDLMFVHSADGLEYGELVERWLRDHTPKCEDPDLAVREAVRICTFTLASHATSMPCNDEWVAPLHDVTVREMELFMEAVASPPAGAEQGPQQRQAPAYPPDAGEQEEQPAQPAQLAQREAKQRRLVE